MTHLIPSPFQGSADPSLSPSALHRQRLLHRLHVRQWRPAQSSTPKPKSLQVSRSEQPEHSIVPMSVAMGVSFLRQRCQRDRSSSVKTGWTSARQVLNLLVQKTVPRPLLRDFRDKGGIRLIRELPFSKIRLPVFLRKKNTVIEVGEVACVVIVPPPTIHVDAHTNLVRFKPLDRERPINAAGGNATTGHVPELIAHFERRKELLHRQDHFHFSPSFQGVVLTFRSASVKTMDLGLPLHNKSARTAPRAGSTLTRVFTPRNPAAASKAQATLFNTDIFSSKFSKQNNEQYSASVSRPQFGQFIRPPFECFA